MWGSKSEKGIGPIADRWPLFGLIPIIEPEEAPIIYEMDIVRPERTSSLTLLAKIAQERGPTRDVVTTFASLPTTNDS